MSIKELVRADYKEFVSMNSHKYPAGLIDALKHTERVPAFIDRLAKELLKVERMGKLNRERIKDTTYSLTEMFLHFLKKKSDEDSMSALEKSRVKRSAHEMDDLSREVFEEDSSIGLTNDRKTEKI